MSYYEKLKLGSFCHIGVSPGSAIVGFPPGILVPPGAIHAVDPVAGTSTPTSLDSASENSR